MRRIVVTGLGAVTPLAAGVETSWSRLLAGRSGIRRLPDEVVRDLPAKIGGVVPSLEEDPDAGFDPNTVFASKDQRKVDRFLLFGLAAAREALAQAKWQPASETDRLRTATIIASGIGGFPAITEAVRTVDQRGVRRLSPFTIPSFLVNLAAGHVSIRHGFKGPLGAPVTACAAGIQAIGDAARLIRANEADIAVCGGTEACMNIVSLGGFAAARSLSTGFNETPAQASRPFDMLRDGFVMGEGAGILVIEELSHALARGAKPFAELVGYGTTADAHHVTAGPEDGGGARRAMEIAIAQAGISPREVRHLNAHATSTPVGDLGEIEAIKSVFGRVIRLVNPPQKLVCDSHVTVVRCLEVDPEYIRTWLRSDHVYALIEDRAAGSTNQVELTAQMAIGQIIPLPPLAEQHRIVAKVDELMALCDRLDASLISGQDYSRRLLEALLAEAFYRQRKT